MNIVGKKLETTIERLNEIATDDTLNGEEKLYLSEQEENGASDFEIMSEPTGEDSKKILLELEAAILLWGFIFQLTIVWFVPNKETYSIGLWFGCIIAMCLAYHMWISLEKALDMDQKNARAYITTRSIMRYASIVIILGISMAFLSKWAHPLAVFLGVMTLKSGAYTQPFVHKLVHKDSTD